MRSTIVLLALVLAVPVAHADRAIEQIDAPRLRGRHAQRTRAARPGVRRRLRVPPAQVRRPPIREVRVALRQMGPDVQRCADQHPPPGTRTRRRLRMRVWLQPNGRWTLEVPELEVRPGQAVPAAQRRERSALRRCLHSQLSRRIARYMRRFRGRTRQKVERAFVVTMPGPPPTVAVIARRVRTRRRQLIACVPGSGAEGTQTELVVRGTLTPAGDMRLTGLAVPEQVPFDAATRCVLTELAQVENARVTQARDFEVVIPYRFTAPP